MATSLTRWERWGMKPRDDTERVVLKRLVLWPGVPLAMLGMFSTPAWLTMEALLSASYGVWYHRRTPANSVLGSMGCCCVARKRCQDRY